MTSRSTVSVGQYLFARIKELGVRSVHGVPGTDLSHNKL
jgi:TPP-dependent 2-oxoacid decarboxylase